MNAISFPVPPEDPAARPDQRRPALSVEGLRAYYLTNVFGVRREVRAVDDISFAIMPNEIYGIAGESSSGKTSLIKAVAGAVRPPLTVVGGEVRYNFAGETISLYGGGPVDLSAVRWKHLSYIMQGSMNVLNPVRRIRRSFEDFAYRHIGRSRAEFNDIVSGHLERLHLSPKVLNAYPHELSGGMRQRVTIALATVCRPDFIIADEPTTALDVVVQKRVLGLIREVQRQIGSSLLFVTHDMSVHANLTDRLGIMYAGRLVEEGPTREIFAAPKHPYTKHLIASLPRIGDRTVREGLKGSPPNLSDPPPGCRFHPRCPAAMEVCRKVAPPFVESGARRRVACFAAEPETIPDRESRRPIA
ncbi:ABC transporter ATP-binding protein [Acuticoccus kandeliae]|uniref:ABC transporter ATP-binding protein n=1 Tax=Acuticoccus kandeliae TaxID=2073160 RepID=UPI000D3E0AEF|nr:ABC transporter ATP-binding protein [Acuticoccus kandeliae]